MYNSLMDKLKEKPRARNLKEWKDISNNQLKGKPYKIYNKFFHRFLFALFIVNFICFIIFLIVVVKYFDQIKEGAIYLANNWSEIRTIISNYVNPI